MGFFDDINQSDLDADVTGEPIVPAVVIEEDEEDILSTEGEIKDDFILDTGEEELDDDEFGEIINEIESTPSSTVSIVELGGDTAEPEEVPKKKPKKEPELPKEEPKPTKQTAPVSTDRLVIPVGSVVDGTIKCPGDAVVGGEVTGAIEGNNITILSGGKIGGKGNADVIISASGEVNISGDINGSIKCSSISFSGCKVTGDIINPDKIEIGAGGKLIGNISDGGNVVIGGAVKGTISAKETVTVTSTGVVKGSIIAKDVVIEKGSRIQGSIERTGEDITDDIFN